ncbi:PRC-barrel domain-containing protein [Roseovarius dicentrarchi]|uniref:PRC-barrel domain-containing protein n=1 Tax=Roseovarius dicentrarchi TaxID=2250573 RepID=UPI000DE9F8FC|nr:PRC-barrel domain-containing protein [Roseovarius dicentrarchi]
MPRPMIIAATMLTAMPLAAQEAAQGAGVVDTRDGTFLQSVDDTNVINANGEKIGEVEEILVDSDGQPAGFLIDLGGLLNFGDHDVSVPLGALEWNGKEYVSKMTEEQLENLAPWDE